MPVGLAKRLRHQALAPWDPGGGLGEAEPRRLLGIDCRHLEPLVGHGGLIAPPEGAGCDQPHRLWRSVPADRIGELGADQEARQPRGAIGALLEPSSCGARSRNSDAVKAVGSASAVDRPSRKASSIGGGPAASMA